MRKNDTEYLSSIPGMKEKIIAGMNTPLEECVAEEKTNSNCLEKCFEGYQGNAKCKELNWGPEVGKEVVK